jgi:hypothetical protein
MKVALAYYLLFFYTVALCKPVLPLVSDFLAHAFSQQKHLRTVHRHQGAEHVHLEMAKASGDAQQEQNSPRTAFSDPVSVHLLLADEGNGLVLPALPKKTFGFYTSSILYQFVGVDIPPPKRDAFTG